jgi:hypothetical protein
MGMQQGEIVMSLLQLTHAVEYRRKSGSFDLGWHTLAAFDVERIAEQYASACREANIGDELEYRVRKLEDHEFAS